MFCLFYKTVLCKKLNSRMCCCRQNKAILHIGEDKVLDDSDGGGLCVSIETGSPGSVERGESLPKSHRRHFTGEAPQPALGTLVSSRCL